MNPKAQAKTINRITDSLCDEFKSHSYEINRGEARELGLKITNANPQIEQAMNELLAFYVSRPSFAGPPVPGTQVRTCVGWLESSAGSMRAEADYLVAADGQMKPVSDSWVSF